jgi:non-canonical purine NTP pyrophosphatase (RdgB/HAM1 family)
MQTISLVTGNKGKLAEWQRLFPSDIHLEAVDLDLDEIQSMDLEAIALDKAKRAFEHVGSPVLVEDVSAGLVNLGGLPGPFIKYFELSLGIDALYQLAKQEGDPAVVTCTIAYADGSRSFAVRASVPGTVVSARGDNGFGFDAVFRPDGHEQTFGEMTHAQKDAISHRTLAIQELLKQL